MVPGVALDPQQVAARVEDALRAFSEPRVAAALTRLLIPPRACLLDWDYGHPHREFPAPRYPAFIVAEFPESGTGIAYSEYGFGPGCPWGLIFLDRLGYGMDCGWYVKLEDAFRESMAWNEEPPPGYELD